MEHRVIYTRPYDSEIEYLQSSGTQYFDTGVTINSDYTVSIKASFTSANNPNECLWCARSNSKVNTFTIFKMKSNNGAIRFDYNTSQYNISNINVSLLHTYKAVGNKLYKDDTLIYTATADTFTTGSTVTIFASRLTPTDVPNNFAIGKLYAFSILDNNEVTLIDLIPVRIGSIGYMYDKVSKKLFANQGTGNFVLGNDVANPVPNIRRMFRFNNKRFVMPMPYDSKVEYLKSNSNQYLDIGIIPKSGYRAICVYMPEKQFTDPRALFGQRTSYQATDAFSVFIQCGTSPRDYHVQYASNQSPVSVINAPNILHTVELGKKSYLDGNLLKTVTTTFNGAYTISIFAIHQNFQGSVNYNDRRMKDCRVYSFKLYNDSDTLIFDGIPVRRGTKGYMYDKVSGRLFGNLGTGKFIIGNDIND